MMLLEANRAIPDGLVKHSGEFMGDEQSELNKSPQRLIELLKGFFAGEYAGDKPLELKKLLPTLFGLLVGFLIGNYIANWHVIRDHGLKAVRYDHFLGQAIGAIGLLTCFWLVGRHKEATTLSIDPPNGKNLR
jgi:hypothetical protein